MSFCVGVCVKLVLILVVAVDLVFFENSAEWNI
jgi:hypothetical protein